MESGWIKIHRKFSEWEWIDKPEMVSLFIYLLLTAGSEDRMWHGLMVKRGQLVTSVSSLSKKLGISTQTLRTCLGRLKSTNEITIEPTKRFTIITISNYDVYQNKTETANKQINKQINKPLTNNQQTTNKQLTTSKEYKNIYNNISESSNACVRTCEEVVEDFMKRFSITLDTFCKNNGMNKEQFRSMMNDVLVDWSLKGWEPSFIKKGDGDFETVHLKNAIKIRFQNQKEKKTNETEKTSRLQQRRGGDSTAQTRQSFDGAL